MFLRNSISGSGTWFAKSIYWTIDPNPLKLIISTWPFTPSVDRAPSRADPSEFNRCFSLAGLYEERRRRRRKKEEKQSGNQDDSTVFIHQSATQSETRKGIHERIHRSNIWILQSSTHVALGFTRCGNRFLGNIRIGASQTPC